MSTTITKLAVGDRVEVTNTVQGEPVENGQTGTIQAVLEPAEGLEALLMVMSGFPEEVVASERLFVRLDGLDHPEAASANGQSLGELGVDAESFAFFASEVEKLEA